MPASVLDILNPITISNYARGAWDGISQNHWFLSELRKRGKIEYDVTGDVITGSLEAGRYDAKLTAPGQDIQDLFVTKRRFGRWTFSWGELSSGLRMDRGVLRRNGGKEALVRLRDTEVPAMLRDLFVKQGSGLEYEILNRDGSTYSGDGLPWYGFPSVLAAAGDSDLQGFNPATGAGTGVAPADTDKEVAWTTKTYGGLSMAPSGVTDIDNPEVDSWMPTMVNTSYNWGAGVDSEAANILECLQYAVNRACRFGRDAMYMPDLGLLGYDLFSYLGEKLASKQTVYVQNTQKGVATPNLGYHPHELMHAGLKWTWAVNQPVGRGMLVKFNQCSMKIQPLYKDQMNGAPFKTTGEDAGIVETNVNFDPMRRQYLVAATIPGQLILNPRHLVGLGNFS